MSYSFFKIVLTYCIALAGSEETCNIKVRSYNLNPHTTGITVIKSSDVPSLASGPGLGQARPD